MENDAEEILSPMLLEDSPPPDDTKKRAWPCWLQIPLGILIVGLVGGGVLCFLSFADSKDVERVKAGNISLGDFQERNRRHVGCIEGHGWDYLGWDLEGGSKIKVTANEQECADYSASLPGSRFWTWSKTTKKCYPKSSNAGSRLAGSHLISGNNKCASSGCTIEQAKDYFGWDLEGGSKIKVTANQQECADYSASLPGSRFWTWSKTTKRCFPKSSKAGRRVAGIHLISGNNRCANSGFAFYAGASPGHVDPTGCLIENNIVYWGNDIANKIVETSQACADFCASTPGGLFWTFDTKTKRCYVKSSDSGRKTRQDRISGNRKCGGGGDGGGGTWVPLGEADCWNPCGRKGGLCQHFCGHKGYCCRKGFDDCPVLASEWASPLRHTCVNSGQFDCTDTFKNRLASFEYNYYPGYWMAHYGQPGIGWASSSEAKSKKEFQWILHDCGDSVCMESKKPYTRPYLHRNHRFIGVWWGGYNLFDEDAYMWRPRQVDSISDPSDGSNENLQHRIFCDSCNRGGLENTTFSNCQIINTVAGHPNSTQSNSRLYSNGEGYLFYCSDCGHDSWFNWRIESPPTRVYWKVVLDHCNRGTTNETVTYIVKPSITTSTSTTTEVTVDTKISLAIEAGELLENVGRTVGGELSTLFKWHRQRTPIRSYIKKLAQSKTTAIQLELEPGMKWVISQAMGEASWTSIATDTTKAEKIPC